MKSTTLSRKEKTQHKNKKRDINTSRGVAQCTQKNVNTYGRTLLSTLLLKVLIYLVNTYSLSTLTLNIVPAHKMEFKYRQDHHTYDLALRVR